jgi:hypothetical protein
MKTLHTDSAYTGFLAAHDDEIPMSIRDNQHDNFMSKNEASARRSNREKVNFSLRKVLRWHLGFYLILLSLALPIYCWVSLP